MSHHLPVCLPAHLSPCTSNNHHRHYQIPSSNAYEMHNLQLQGPFHMLLAGCFTRNKSILTIQLLAWSLHIIHVHLPISWSFTAACSLPTGSWPARPLALRRCWRVWTILRNWPWSHHWWHAGYPRQSSKHLAHVKIQTLWHIHHSSGPECLRQPQDHKPQCLLHHPVQVPQGHVPGLILGQVSVSWWQWHPDSHLLGCHSPEHPQLDGDRFQPGSAREISQHPISQWGLSWGDLLQAHLPGLRMWGGQAWQNNKIAASKQCPLHLTAWTCHGSNNLCSRSPPQPLTLEVSIIMAQSSSISSSGSSPPLQL